jgi:hypothetical protein
MALTPMNVLKVAGILIATMWILDATGLTSKVLPA